MAAIIGQESTIVVEFCCTNKEIKVSYQRAGGTESPSFSSKDPTSAIDSQKKIREAERLGNGLDNG